MGFLDSMKAEAISAPTTPNIPTVGNASGKAKGSPEHARFLADGRALAESADDETKKKEGSKSDKIAFIQCLGDGTHPSKRSEHGNPNIDTLVVIGYAFKALEDVMVPVAPYKPAPKLFNDVEEPTERLVKAGEEFYLNIIETGALITRPEYCGKFTGEGKTVTLSISISKATGGAPRPVLKIDKGSIKSNIESVCYTHKEGDKIIYDGCKPQYAAFEPYFVRKSPRKSAAAAKNAAEHHKALSYAFQAYLNGKNEE